MKIAFYNVTTATNIGGIETYCWEMAKIMKSFGLSSVIISGKGDFIKYQDIELKIFPFKKREKFLNLGRRYRKFMERLSFFYNAKEYLRNNYFDIFLIFKPFDFLVTYFVKKWHPKCLTVFISGGEDFLFGDKFFAKSIDLFISVSKNNAQIIEKRYKKEVNIVPNGVDVKLFKPNFQVRKEMRKNLGIDDKKVLISVGRIVGWKGYQLVIDVLTLLPKDYVYVLIGEGEYLETLKMKTKKLGVENRVIFLGKKSHKELFKYYVMGDVFLQPSIGHEAFGITVIEAMASGLPVVGSISGGIKELVKEGINGYLFNPYKEEFLKELCEKIKLAYKKKEFLGSNARKFVKENYSWENCAKKLLLVIKRSLYEKSSNVCGPLSSYSSYKRSSYRNLDL